MLPSSVLFESVNHVALFSTRAVAQAPRSLCLQFLASPVFFSGSFSLYAVPLSCHPSSCTGADYLSLIPARLKYALVRLN